MRARLILIGVLLLGARSARADRGAFTLEASAGPTVESVRLPPSLGNASQVGTTVSLNVAGWYSLTNNVEFGVRAFWEPSADWVHEGASSGQFDGSLTSTSTRFGGVAGARFVRGVEWQFMAGLSAGFSQRMFSNLNLYDVSGASPRSFGLELAAVSTTSVLLCPSVGFRWTGDRLAIGIEPRVELLFGPGAMWAVSIPLTLSWSWYL